MANKKIVNNNIDRTKVLSILAFIVLGIFLMPGIVYPNISGNAVYSGGAVTKDNLASYLEQQQIIKDLPKSGVLNLKLFSNVNGNKVWEESYILTKGKVSLGESNKPDAIIYLNSNYINSGDFCTTVKTAMKDWELDYELKKSEFSLLLKYGGMMKYKSCFGI